MKRLLAAAALAAIIIGCATVTGDPFVVRVEQTETVAKSTFDLVLNVDNDNRAFWQARVPQFHAFAEWLRVPQTVDVTNTLPRAAAMIWSLNDVKVTYKAARNSGNSNALYAAWATLNAALSQATTWLTTATNTPGIPAKGF